MNKINFGLPILLCAVLSYSVNGELCSPHVPITNGFEDLVIQARVYGAVDRRGELSTLGKTLTLGGQKFSQSELSQIRSSVGALFCPPQGTLPQMAETAFLIGSNREITTAAHGVVDEWGTKRDLSKCFFENFEIPPRRIALKADSPRNILSLQPDANDHRDDRARLELVSPMSGAKPFSPDFSQKKLAKGTEVVLVAAQHHDLKLSGKDPILSPCSVGSYYDSGDGLSRMKTDCDADGGSSGGVYLFRDDDGKLYAKALHIGATDGDYLKIPNHAPFNNESNASAALVIDQSFLNWYSK